jgi:dolichol-phosphate mannosyltransferase
MILILLPAYNEERDLPVLLERIRTAMDAAGSTYKVLVVNDGSQDRTLEIARSFAVFMPLEVLDHGVNKGLGSAMLTGLAHAAKQSGSEDVIIAMDADNTHDPSLIPTMVERIRAGSDVVIASRYERGGEEIGLNPIRKMLSRGASVLLNVSFAIPGARDYTCGYRAYSGRFLQKAFAFYGDRFIEETGFTCMAEILVKMSMLGAKVSEVPLILRYDFKSGRSKMKFGRTIRRYFQMIYHIKSQERRQA